MILILINKINLQYQNKFFLLSGLISLISLEIFTLTLFSISFASKLFVLENIEKTNTHKNKIILFIKKIYLILLSYDSKVI